MEDEKVVDAIVERLNDERRLFEELIEDYRNTRISVSELRSVAEVVVDVMEALGRVRDPKAVQPIISVLECFTGTEAWNSLLTAVVLAGINALGWIGDPKAVDAITRFFPYPKEIQAQAVSVIKLIGAPAVGAMIELLSAENSAVKKNALRALVAIGDEQSVEHIIPLLNDCDPSVVGCAARALAELIGRR